MSRIKTVDRTTGDQSDFITGLRTAIDILPMRTGNDVDYLVLENNFAPAPAFPPTGAAIRRFETPSSDATVVNECTLYRPTSMSLDKQSATIYVTGCCEERWSRCGSIGALRSEKLALSEHPEALRGNRIKRSRNPARLDGALGADESLGFEITEDEIDRRMTEPSLGPGDDVEAVKPTRLALEDFKRQ